MKILQVKLLQVIKFIIVANVAARNAEDGISTLQAAEGVLLELATLNTRLRECNTKVKFRLFK